jgi:signal transduction histidine kinase
MDRTQKIDAQCTALAEHFATRRTAILQAWRTAVAGDPQLATAASLPRTQFYDHIPGVLDAFERKLHAWPVRETASAEEEQKQDAASHGLVRWQQGFPLREVTREWGHLHLCLLDELEGYTSAHPDLEPGVMPFARRALAELCGEGVSESTAQYFHLQQIEAVGRLRDLEQALEHSRRLEEQRVQLLHEAAHDLRGGLGTVVNATACLKLENISESTREFFFHSLQRSVASLHSMLNDVMDLARLEAGQEQRCVEPFDAAVLLRELCEGLRPLAGERGLLLKAIGPTTLPVEGDAVKTRRIVQNLLLNALKYTQEGGVTVTWGDSRENDAERWMVCVQDTGPGFHAGPGAPLVRALEEATEETHQVEQDARGDEEHQGGAEAASPPPRSPDPRPVRQERGEGIGLSIVKRLSELLEASVEPESEPDEGTTFRVILPRRYRSTKI